MSRALGGIVFACLAVAGAACTDARARDDGEPAGDAEGPVSDAGAPGRGAGSPYIVVLGISQDGGTPQAGDVSHPGWSDPARRRRATSLGLVDPASGQRWIFEATPDFREQLHELDRIAPTGGRPGVDGIFLTHAHMGHYLGLAFLGHESMGARGVVVHVMPRMAEYLRSNGPWSQLVAYENILLEPMEAGVPVPLNERLRVTPLLVPHRQEFSEVVGFRIEGPERSALFLPDIDAWEDWDPGDRRIEEEIARVDVALLDGTFYANGEIPGRDMSGFPHPFIRHSVARFAPLPEAERSKVRFIHLNHTNPALWPGAERDRVVAAGFGIADEGDRIGL